MLAKEILKKVKKIQLKTARLSNEIAAGHYVSAFKGSGIEFEEVREYIPGDDIRSIDWNVTARTGNAYIKRYTEERELTVFLVVDLSASQYFGSSTTLKSELAAEISALLAFLAIKNHDKVGLLIFTDHCEKYLPPQKGRTHVLRVIREILGYQPTGKRTDLQGALNYLNHLAKHRGIVFLVSDFQATEYEKPLKILAKKHDLVAISLADPREAELPPVGLLELIDSETGKRALVDSYDPKIRAAFREQTLARQTALKKLFTSNKIDLIKIQTDQSYLDPLQKFFLTRESRYR